MRIGAALLFLGAFVHIGIIKSRELKRQIDHLSAAMNMLSALYNGLSAKCDALPVLFSALGERSERPEREFFCELSREMDRLDGRSFSVIWQEAVKKVFSAMPGDELDMLSELAGILGCSDIEMQLQALMQCRTAISEVLSTKKTDYPEGRKLVLGLSFSAGAMAVILLI